MRRVDHHDDAVGGDEGAIGVFAEVFVARSVEQRHPPPVELELERRRRNRNAALLLERHPVRGRMTTIFAAADGPGELDGAGVQQQLLGQRRLAGVRMRNNREGPAPRNLTLEVADCRIDLAL